MLGPDLLQVEVWPFQMGFEEGEGTGMCYAGGGVLEIQVARDDEAWRGYVGVDVVSTIGSGCVGSRDVCEGWDVGGSIPDAVVYCCCNLIGAVDVVQQ